jgi:sugar lactone lactonase YvrE
MPRNQGAAAKPLHHSGKAEAMKNNGWSGTTRSRASERLALVGAFLVLLVVAIPALAVADEPVTSATIATSDLQEVDGSAGFGENLTNPQVAEELPKRNLDREAAIDLISGVFAPALSAAAGPFNGLEVERFMSDNAAVVADEDALVGSDESLLLESTLPLRVEGADGQEEVVNLDLESTPQGLEPEAPLVELAIPSDLGEGVELPDTGVTLRLGEGPEDRSPSLIAESVAAYPNIATDTDFLVAPTPMGLETMTAMRSPDAPPSETIEVDVPKGAELIPKGDGAEVIASGKHLMSVLPPSAIDAAGNPVPVNMTVSGSSLVLTVFPDESTAWPILVDPIFDTFSWYGTTSTEGVSSWHSATTTSAFTPRVCSCFGAPMQGLYIGAAAAHYNAGDQANWFYWVPRLAEEEAKGRVPTSYIAKLSLFHLSLLGNPGSYSPSFTSGIWDATAKRWAGQPGAEAVFGYPGNGATLWDYTLNLENGEPGKRDELAQSGLGLAMSSGESTTISSPREGYFGGATVELGDTVVPTVANASVATKWINQTATDPLSVESVDTGLGLKSVTFELPGQADPTVTNPCIGTAASPCPREWKVALPSAQYDPSKMPEGFDYIPVVAQDVIGNKVPSGSVVRAQLKVDHTAPSLALSGNLTEQAKVGTKLPSYTLNYATADGEDASASALTPYGSAGTGEGQLERPQGLAIDAGGNIWVSDRVNNRITEYGPSGSFIRQINAHGSADGAINEPRGLAATPAGNIWVAENGNKRLQEFSPTGAFIAKITNANFVEPWGVVPGAGGTLWVSDPGAHKLFKFSESGTLLKTVSGHVPDHVLSAPYGIAVDSSGDVWTADTAANAILEFDSNGNYLTAFGTEGSGNGQLKAPTGLAITPSGHIFVSEDQNARVQEFQPDGSYLRQFGSLGSAANQLSEPRQVAVGPENSLLIADAANHRIARWTHADQDPQSGVAKVEVKLDGSAAKNEAPGCSTKNCQLNNSWTLNADNYSVGSHKIEVIATDAVGLATTKTLTVETHGDLTPPSVALSGSMTEQGALGTTRPTYKLKLSATDPGATEERKSGVASTTIKVDGKVVDSTSPGCPAEGCSITREWTLESSAYSAGAHTVEAIATDGAGHTTTKTLAITIARDTTAPELSATGELYVAPEGWIEQKEYNAFAAATDEGGYGVTSLELKIDGTVVKSSTGTCSVGGCSKFFFSGVNMSKYSGGSHPAELVATDGAGNVTKKPWRIRVVPKGSVPPSESIATIEALEETEAEAEIVVPPDEVISEAERLAGNDPGLEQSGTDLTSTGTPVSSTLTTEPTDGVSIETTEGQIGVSPIGAAPATTEVAEEVAAVAPNTDENVDTVNRPKYNGVLTFEIIRDATAPEHYEWEVELHPGQELKSVEEGQAVGVFYEDGTEAMLISVEGARDAVGKEVPTTLEIVGERVLRLTVSHRSNSFSYPITAGPAFEVGYSKVELIPPPAEEPESEEHFGFGEVSAPGIATGEEGGEAGISSARTKRWVKAHEWDCQTHVCEVGLWRVDFYEKFFFNGHKGEIGGEAWHEDSKGSYKDCNDYRSVTPWSITINACKWIGNHAFYGYGEHMCANDEYHVNSTIRSVPAAMSMHDYGDGYVGFHWNADC